jgi:hypothetical protein
VDVERCGKLFIKRIERRALPSASITCARKGDAFTLGDVGSSLFITEPYTGPPFGLIPKHRTKSAGIVIGSEADMASCSNSGTPGALVDTSTTPQLRGALHSHSLY